MTIVHYMVADMTSMAQSLTVKMMLCHYASQQARAQAVAERHAYQCKQPIVSPVGSSKVLARPDVHARMCSI